MLPASAACVLCPSVRLAVTNAQPTPAQHGQDPGNPALDQRINVSPVLCDLVNSFEPGFGMGRYYMEISCAQVLRAFSS
ncbi:uncharacterized protein PHACADRAFT_257013 [Phanerochaete carnosa HHB-10118-sp]|uniref:Secreted protein n=1 Tax=Phanerochaete carnosa (strain HHB-10118-sp) TaxID=650164 RepID=K5V0K5_PHACS|nr:uncharacterized protein PHACADRAFT_257013 [Phanerochaete carnosa HHB-10118-sp]EKM56006.1 hypothetical protein PHACADRAFT_257013 [Phanerochaete carnosa HHB-10118-sp]